MSHSIRKTNLGNSALCEITIIDYVQGGEAFTLAEFGITGPITSVQTIALTSIIGTNPDYLPTTGGLGLTLLQAVTGYAKEAPSTVGLNMTFLALVHGQ